MRDQAAAEHDAQLLAQAKRLAQQHAMFVIAKPVTATETKYTLIRKHTPHNICLGARTSIDAFLRLVQRCVAGT